MTPNPELISETRAWFSKAAHDIRPDAEEAEDALNLARETVMMILSFLPDEVRS